MSSESMSLKQSKKSAEKSEIGSSLKGNLTDTPSQPDFDLESKKSTTPGGEHHL